MVTRSHVPFPKDGCRTLMWMPALFQAVHLGGDYCKTSRHSVGHVSRSHKVIEVTFVATFVAQLLVEMNLNRCTAHVSDPR